MNQTRNSTQEAVRLNFAWPVAVAATGGGLIHLEAFLDHRSLVVVAIGLFVMGTGQWLFAGAMLIRPSLIVLVWAGALHAAILSVWILSRTIGLAFIPGAETAAPVGVADVVANTFSIAVVGAAVIALAAHMSEYTGLVPSRAVSTARAVVLIGVLILTQVAVSEPHHHDPKSAAISESAIGHHDSETTTPTQVHDDHQRPPP
jgi:hypothetical protein